MGCEFMREQICKMNPEKRGHDACGIGAVVDRWGRPSRQTVEDALEIVEHLGTGRGRTPPDRLGTVWGSSCRSAIPSLSLRPRRWGWT